MGANSAKKKKKKKGHQFRSTSSKSTAQTRWILWSVGHMAPCGTASVDGALETNIQATFQLDPDLLRGDRV